MLILRKASQLMRTPACPSRDFVTELWCKKAAQKVEAGMHKTGVTH